MSRSPVSSAARIRLLLIRPLPSSTISVNSTSTPRAAATWRSRSASPLRLFPKRKLAPTTIRCACRVSSSTVLTNASALSWASSGVKGTSTSCSMPSGCSSSSFSLGRSSRSRASPNSTSRGWGQKLTTVGTAVAPAMAWLITRRCPACSPSKLPSARAVGLRASCGEQRGINAGCRRCALVASLDD